MVFPVTCLTEIGGSWLSGFPGFTPKFFVKSQCLPLLLEVPLSYSHYPHIFRLPLPPQGLVNGLELPFLPKLSESTPLFCLHQKQRRLTRKTLGSSELGRFLH